MDTPLLSQIKGHNWEARADDPEVMRERIEILLALRSMPLLHVASLLKRLDVKLAAKVLALIKGAP